MAEASNSQRRTHLANRLQRRAVTSELVWLCAVASRRVLPVHCRLGHRDDRQGVTSPASQQQLLPPVLSECFAAVIILKFCD